jgi:hypothetical protein
MKKVLIVLAVVGFVCMGCDNGTASGVTTGPFFGTWIMDGYAGYTFSDDLFFTQFANGGYMRIGTFTYTDTVITFSFDNRVTSMYYTLTDTVLNLQMKEDDPWWVGNYIKKRYDNGSTSGSGTILGLSYSEKKEISAFQSYLPGHKGTAYLLDISYNEALRILTQQLGKPDADSNDVGAQGNGDELLSFMSRPNWVMFQDTGYDYRLLSISKRGGGVAWDTGSFL